MQGKRLKHYMSLDYATALWVKDGRFKFVIQDLSLVASGDDVAAAHQELIRRKEEYFGSFIDAGREAEITLPSALAEEAFRRSFLRRIAPFSFKLVSAALVTVLVLLAVVPALEFQVKKLGRSARIAARDLPWGLVEGMERMKPISEDRQEKLARAVRAYLESLDGILSKAGVGLADKPPKSAANR